MATPIFVYNIPMDLITPPNAGMRERDKVLFLTLLDSHQGLETSARKDMGLTKRAYEQALIDDPEFALQVEDILDMHTDILEKEAYRRAVEGVEEGVYYKGDRVDSQQKYSDTLLLAMLKGKRREVYGDKKEITGAHGGPIVVEVKSFSVESSGNYSRNRHHATTVEPKEDFIVDVLGLEDSETPVVKFEDML